MHPALLHRVGQRLSPAELSACRLDGVLVEIGDAYMPADVPDSREARALTIRALLRPGLAAAGPTAAWLHGAGSAPPARHHARPTTTTRMRVQSTALLRIHEAPLSEDDVVLIGGIPVCGRPETLSDLARAGSDEARSWLRLLGVEEPADLLDAVARLRGRSRMPGKHAAIAALERCYEEVTRYTS